MTKNIGESVMLQSFKQNNKPVFDTDEEQNSVFNAHSYKFFQLSLFGYYVHSFV